MNAQPKTVEQDEAELQPAIRAIDRKLEEADKLLSKTCQPAVEAAAEKLIAAKKRREDNDDISLAGQRMKEVRDAQEALEDEKERLRIVTKTMEDLQKQRASTIATWKREKKQRLLTKWQTSNAALDAQMTALQNKRIEEANTCLAKLHELDHSYPEILSHGNPNFYLNGDILVGKKLPSLEITDTRAEFKWLQLNTGIRN